MWAYRVLEAGNVERLGRLTRSYQLVEGVVAQVGESGGRVYLNFDKDWRRDFTILLERKDGEAFKAAGIDWKTAKAIAREICARMAADSPEKYLVNMSKAQRKGRIFLDYLRNDRMSTAVAPLSPRAREGATVSMPLTWAQVKRGLNPKAYTLRTAPKLIGKSSAWSDYDKARPSLATIAKKLNS